MRKFQSCQAKLIAARQIEMFGKLTGMNAEQTHNWGDGHRREKQAAQRKVTDKKTGPYGPG